MTYIKRWFLFVVVIGILVPVFAVHLDGYREVRVPSLDDTGIPADYYNRRCVIPYGMTVEVWLTIPKWPYPYEIGVWDCSQEAAFTEWALENCGYEADIVLTAIYPPFETAAPPPGAVGHAYVRVKIDGKWHNYEATSRRWLTEKDMRWFRCPVVLRNIYGLYSFCRNKESFFAEFAWWRR